MLLKERSDNVPTENLPYISRQHSNLHSLDIDCEKEIYLLKTGKKTVTSVELYIKPEDNRAYYVIDKATGFITL